MKNKETTMTGVSRREVLSGLAVLGFTATELSRVVRAQAQEVPPELAWPPAVNGISQAYPTGDAILVKELVGAAHSNLDRVKAIVSRQPALARAGWDWGYGDWETALGAASHVGNRPIAEFLLAHGAPPTLYSSTMLGHLDVVKAMIAAQPGVQRVRGPHGIPLLAHARAGGPASAAVLAYLESLGGANDPVPAQPLSAADRAEILGRYSFGPGARDVFVVDEVREVPGITRIGAVRRGLVHRGELAFSPIGAEEVRIRFVRAGDRSRGLTIADPDLLLTATRLP
jgi:hypothetical protein